MRSIELFSGAGGLAKGLELAGFEHVGLVEVNKHAGATLCANFDRRLVHLMDIRNLNLAQFRSIDVVAGGPPCQPFSLGGKHQAEQDSRDLFPEAMRAIAHLRPKAFVFENVKGLLRSTFADYFEYIILRLTYPELTQGKADWRGHLAILRSVNPLTYDGVCYDVQFQLMNAANYGVPQLRERVVIVGMRSDLPGEWRFPAPTHSRDRLLWEMHVTGDYWARHGVRQAVVDPVQVAKLQANYGLLPPLLVPWQTVRDALAGLPEPQAAHGIADHVFRDGARSYPGHTGSGVDWPSKTIKAGDHGVPGGENMIRFADGAVRYFTVLEAKRIQTFPDDFRVVGAWGEAMRQIGNAVPVRLAESIARSLQVALVAGMLPVKLT
jgi:DNA (cytosine-5)-methyltransferase 1